MAIRSAAQILNNSSVIVFTFWKYPRQDYRALQASSQQSVSGYHSSSSRSQGTYRTENRVNQNSQRRSLQQFTRNCTRFYTTHTIFYTEQEELIFQQHDSAKWRITTELEKPMMNYMGWVHLQPEVKLSLHSAMIDKNERSQQTQYAQPSYTAFHQNLSNSLWHTLMSSFTNHTQKAL
jgi:hypothetical protein